MDSRHTYVNNKDWITLIEDSDLRARIFKYYRTSANDLTLQEFLEDERTGILRLCQELNIWMQEMPKFRRSHLVRYEDLKNSTEHELSQIARFLDLCVTEKSISDAVEFARFENMQKRESEQSARTQERHDQRVSVSENNGLKARKGVVAGYTRHLSAIESERYQTMIANNLDHALGYARLPEINAMKFPIIM